MKLWILEPCVNREYDPWKAGYDTYAGHVIRAETERKAREIAARHHGDEGANAWLHSTLSTCIELLPEGPEGTVLYSYIGS